MLCILFHHYVSSDGKRPSVSLKSSKSSAKLACTNAKHYKLSNLQYVKKDLKGEIRIKEFILVFVPFEIRTH